jgi:acetyltransferase-like isoleucine patch superfamily enzyme
MPLQIIDNGRNNRIEIDPAVLESGNGAIVLDGNNNSISIGARCVASSCSIRLGSGSRLLIEEDVRLAAVEIMGLERAVIEIGARTSFTWHTRLFLHEAAAIRIGRNCLIASETLFSVSDMHSIIDRATGQRLNPPADITLHDSVWVAHAATILKGSTIGEGSIVGLGSVVTGSIGAYVLASGRPATMKREGVTWRPDLLSF